MSQANVVTSAANILWYTDRASIATSDTPVFYQVYITALGNEPAVGNLWSQPVQIGCCQTQEIYVGSGNYLTITGTDFTAAEIGTMSSAQASVFNGQPNYQVAYISGANIETQNGNVMTTQVYEPIVTN